MLGHRIWGKRLGIESMGRIGQAVARRAHAFGLKKFTITTGAGFRRSLQEDLHATCWESLDQMLARMDILSIHFTAHTGDVSFAVGAPPQAHPAGSLCCQHRARRGDRRERAGPPYRGGGNHGAGLDVFEHEPAVSPKLVKLARAGKVVLLPHLASATVEGRIDMGEKVIVNIKTFLDGHRPPDRVLPSML